MQTTLASTRAGICGRGRTPIHQHGPSPLATATPTFGPPTQAVPTRTNTSGCRGISNASKSRKCRSRPMWARAAPMAVVINSEYTDCRSMARRHRLRLIRSGNSTHCLPPAPWTTTARWWTTTPAPRGITRQIMTATIGAITISPSSRATT